MNIIDFARLVRSGNEVLPPNTFMKGHLIWHSVEELQREPYDATRNSWYLQQFEEANKELAHGVEQERLKIESEAQGKIDNKVGQLWQLIGRYFQWWNPQTESSIPVLGKLRWCGEKSITVLTSAGVKRQDFHCAANGSEIGLKGILDGWVQQYATRLLAENAQPRIAVLVKDVLRAFPFVDVHCPYAEKLIHPKQACSIFTSGSAETLGCNQIKLELRPL